jgi:spore coat polysaccharide biosynthesis protein SpsF
MYKNLVLLQARMESTRLPGKVMMKICGKPMIQWQISRILKANLIDEIVVLIPNTQKNDVLADFLESISVKIYRGSHENVYDRFFQASRLFPSQNIIRLTADCPLVMPKLLDEMVTYFNISNLDYLSNTLAETFPDGLDIEIFSSTTLHKLNEFNLNEAEKEFVTYGIYTRPDIFKLENFENSSKLGNERWTVDYPEDFEFVSNVFSHFKDQESIFSFNDVLNFLILHPNSRNKRSGDFRNTALKKWEIQNKIE